MTTITQTDRHAANLDAARAFTTTLRDIQTLVGQLVELTRDTGPGCNVDLLANRFYALRNPGQRRDQMVGYQQIRDDLAVLVARLSA